MNFLTHSFLACFIFWIRVHACKSLWSCFFSQELGYPELGGLFAKTMFNFSQYDDFIVPRQDRTRIDVPAFDFIGCLLMHLGCFQAIRVWWSSDSTWSHFFYYVKSWNGRIYLFANLKSVCHLHLKGQIQLKQIYKLVTYGPASAVQKLNLCKAVSIEFANSKKNPICKWISFAISTFAVIKEMASESEW